MLKFLITLSIALCSIVTHAQYESFCATSYDPLAIEPHQVNFKLPASRTVGWKTIPTVVHIVYHDSIENSYFSEGYVDTAMASVNYYFEEAFIQFDVLDIDYTNLGDYGWGEAAVSGQVCFPTYGTQNTILANDISWEEDYYCNIYIIPNMCEYVLGWSYITNYINNARDGVWVSHNAFGFGDWLPARNNANMCLVHELGHYCGLHHVFQDTYNCLDDADLHDGESGYVYGDLVPDTPPITPSWECNDEACHWWYYPEGLPNWNQSRSWSDYEHNNHMDYYADSCRQVFTSGQVERMHLKLEFQRAGLFGGDPFCFCDLNGDGIIGVLDLLEVTAHYGEHINSADIDNDGIVGASDLSWILTRYGVNCNDGNPNWVTTEEGGDRKKVRTLLQTLEKL